MSLDIKQLLRERGLTQKAVAERLAVSEPTVSAWASALAEGRHARVPVEKARPLADVLGISESLVRPDIWPPAKAEAA